MSQKSLLEQVAEFVVTNQVTAASVIRAKVARIGYATLTQLMKDLETIGVVGPIRDRAPREVLVSHNELPWVLERVREFEAVKTNG